MLPPNKDPHLSPCQHLKLLRLVNLLTATDFVLEPETIITIGKPTPLRYLPILRLSCHSTLYHGHWSKDYGSN